MRTYIVAAVITVGLVASNGGVAKAGDILYVPPGVPHHFTDVKGFRTYLIRSDTLGVVKGQATAGRD
jgi:uncharacterized RmlC-like cupin family protein